MKTAVFSAKDFEQPFLTAANQTHQHELHFFETVLTEKTAVLAKDFPAVSCFVTDHLSKAVLTILAKNNTLFIALRSAGFNHVDLPAARALGLTVARVPHYSPYAVAEFAAGLILTLNRHIHQAYYSVKQHNFLLKNLMGFDLHGKTVGIIGAGTIGTVFAKIMHGFGCRLLVYDPYSTNQTCLNLGVKYLSLKELCQQADIISLHCPLNNTTRYMINQQVISDMKPDVMLINTGRGALIDTQAVIQALKDKKIGYLGIDVYESEENLFFQDLSHSIIQDDMFTRLQSFPNVVVTGHQGYLTQEALSNIAAVTMENITAFEQGTGKWLGC